MAARFNDWDEGEQLARLQCSLRGKAADWLTACSSEDLNSLERFVELLKRRFSPQVQD